MTPSRNPLPPSALLGLAALPASARVRRTAAATNRVRCESGKQCYVDQLTAELVLGKIWRRPRPGRRLECRAYHCGLCQHWHLTSMPLAKGA